MAEATITRRDLETRLIEKCWKDPDFKAAVVADPKGELERHTGQALPANTKIFIHEEDANTLHFSIPMPPPNLGELSDEELERVAGGTDVVVTIALATVILSMVSGVAASASVSVRLTGGQGVRW